MGEDYAAQERERQVTLDTYLAEANAGIEPGRGPWRRVEPKRVREARRHREKLSEGGTYAHVTDSSMLEFTMSLADQDLDRFVGDPVAGVYVAVKKNRTEDELRDLTPEQRRDMSKAK